MAEALKDMVGIGVVEDLARRLAAADSHFKEAAFVSDLASSLENLELKPRIEAIARGINQGLDTDYPAALGTVVRVATTLPLIEGFAAWTLCTFVELFGLDHPELSLSAMEHLTERASCEFAIRPFLRDHWDLAYHTLQTFTEHDDAAVRRLPSEGSRPRLPWATRVQRLLDDPQPGLDLIERLRHDPSEVVRRSVANHLNDVAKDHPDVVIRTLRRWASQPSTDSKMLSHALRTLVKQGRPDALEILGFTTNAAIDIVDFTVKPDVVEMGTHLELAATVRSTSDQAQRLVVDFVIHHITASGQTSPKVFKWAVLDLSGHDTSTLTKRRLVKTASTRTYHPGLHRVDLQVAGQVVADTEFQIVV